MHTRPRLASRTGSMAAILGITLSLAALAVGQVLGSPASMIQKLRRQIDVMSRVVDQVLLDSPNFLVHSGMNVTGFYLPDYGAVFSFDASLTDETFNLVGLSGLPGGIDIRREDDGRTIIIKKERVTKGSKGKEQEIRAGKDEEKADPARLYDQGKEELVQMLVDYAETLSALPPGESVTVVANIRSDRLWKDRKRRELQLRVDGDDLKAYADERLSDRELRSRIRIEEF